MRHEFHLEGPAFRLRPVTGDDSGAIIALRNLPELSRFINATSADPADQRAWLDSYHAREGDYYFIVEGRDGASRHDRALRRRCRAAHRGLGAMDIAAKLARGGRKRAASLPFRLRPARLG